MAVKHHCIICGTLIYSGMYCSSCSREIVRTRTLDEETLEDWITRIRFKVVRFTSGINNGTSLDNFEHSGI